jgi:beta-lactamase class A
VVSDLRALGVALAVVSLLLNRCRADPPRSPAPRDDFARVERETGTRAGVFARDTGTGEQVEHRADERFGYASTHKAFSSAQVLRQNQVADLERRITFSRRDLVSNSPVISKHVDAGMTLREVMTAAMHYSDNTAANLLFREIGGPPALGAFLRGLGDVTTRPARTETGLNDFAPGDDRDTTTPRAFARSLRAVAVGDALPPDKRAMLDDLLRTNPSGGTLVRAAAPPGWQVGDKSGGTAVHGIRNDIAVVRPPNRATIVLAVFTDKPAGQAKYDDTAVARAAGVALGELR